MSQLRSPTLRQRFLVAPLLGLVLLCLLTAAFTYELQRQNALLTRVVEEDLVAFERYADIFIELSEQHVALFDLLNSAPQSDEETLYDNAKQRLLAIHDATRKLREALPVERSANASTMAQRSEALALIEAYRRAATSAVEMTTVNIALASREITLANQRFAAMNHAFEKLLDGELEEIKGHVSDRVALNHVRTLFVALGGISLAALLLILSVGLSRLLSRSLEAQIRLLGELGDPAQADTKAGGGDEVERIGRGIAAFRRTQLDLGESEKQLRAAFDQAGVGMALRDIDPRDSRFLRVNQKLCDILGYTREEFLQLPLADITPPEDRDLAADYNEKLLKGEITSYSREKRYLRKDGRIIWANMTLTAVSAPSGKRNHIISVIEDITGRKEAEEKIRRLNRVYAILSGINTLIVRSHDRQELFKEACRIAVEHGKFGIAWIGELDAKKLEVTPVASAGLEEGNLLTSNTLVIRHDTPQRQSLIASAIRERRAAYSNDIVIDAEMGGERRKEAIRRGYRSAIALPFMVEGAVVGSFSLFAKETNFFDDEEVGLLTELAGNISFALEHMARQERVERLSRIRAVMSEINAAIVRIRDRQSLFDEACRIAAEHGKFTAAWIGTFDRATSELRPVSSVGIDAELLPLLQFSVSSDGPKGRGTIARALQSKRPAWDNDLNANPDAGYTRQQMIQRGYRAAISLPLMVDGDADGVFVLYARERDFFNNEEIAMLTELGADASFALQSISKQQKLDYLSYYDALTGLPNRALFIDRAGQQMRTRGSEPLLVAMVLLNIERFRYINESFGRPGGDDLLEQVARRMEDAFHGKDYVARIGADSFGVVMRDIRDVSAVAHMVESRALGCFREAYRLNGSELRVSAKAGIALFPADGADADTLFKNAEAALKKAQVGGERYLFYAADMNARAAQALTLETRLRTAVETRQFVLHYQPKIDLSNGAICGLEALIRWQDPETGLVPPGSFIPLLEETGLILEVGKWALTQALFQHREWTARGCAVPRIAVNVSAIQLQQKDFADMVINVLQQGGKIPEALELEITESLLMKDVDASIRKLSILRGLGIHIAMDDFGTGYSSLSYIARLPINSIKIDRSFINGMANNPQDMAIVNTIIALAHSLNLRVVAEGVETESQSKLLRLLKCDEAQGFLFSKPLPAEQIEPLLRAPAPDQPFHGKLDPADSIRGRDPVDPTMAKQRLIMGAKG